MTHQERKEVWAMLDRLDETIERVDEACDRAACSANWREMDRLEVELKWLRRDRRKLLAKFPEVRFARAGTC